MLSTPVGYRGAMRCGTILLLAASAWAGDTIEWAKSLEAGRAESVRSGRPLLLYFTFDT